MSIAGITAFDSANRAPRARVPGWRHACAVAFRTLRRALPQACTLCAARAGDALVCAACSAALPRLPSSCPMCALPSPGAAVCGACIVRAPPFVATVAPLVYGFPVDRLLQDMKYRGRLALADWAAAELAIAVDAARAQGDPALFPQSVVALPLAAARQRERGFNQAREIARRLARVHRLPLVDVLQRTRAAVPQAALPWSERARNVRGVFACDGGVRGARIALVDDVMTTGATLAEAARVLRRAGAARVECWVVARTLRPEAP